MESEIDEIGDGIDRAAYNQAGEIVIVLGALRKAYVSAMMIDDMRGAVKALKQIIDVTCGKVKDEEITLVDEMTFSIDGKMPNAEKTYVNTTDGKTYYKDAELWKEVNYEIRKLFRTVERLQDKYGYGMISKDDPGMAVLQN